MKKIQYLSPTSISKFKQDKDEFYLTYLAEDRPEKIPQTQPMSVGSAFDAYAKSFLHEKLFGKGHDARFDLDTLFEAQVQSQNRTWAKEAGKHAFEVYYHSGALADLLLELQSAISEPKFEFEVRGVVNGYREGVTLDIGDMTLLGKPDVHFINKSAAHVVLDWKVNGYCSSYGHSPMPGYVRLRENGRNKGAHKSALVMPVDGVLVNCLNHLEALNDDWARQLSIYAWLCGEEIGYGFIAAIDQLVCKPGITGKPDIRIAEHRLRISRDAQWAYYREAQECWEVSHSDHIFRELSYEDSKARCEILDGRAKALRGSGSDEDRWFANATRI